MKKNKLLNIFLCGLVSFAVASCASGSGSDSSAGGNTGGGSDAVDSGGSSDISLSSRCGVLDGSNQRISSNVTDAERVSVQVLSSDAAIVTRTSGDLAGQRQLVKFHGITSSGVNSLRIQNGIDILNRRLSGGAYFVSAGDSCGFTFSDGGQGVLGQLFTIAGENINELMLAQASAVPTLNETCDGDTIGTCYQGIPIDARQPTDIELELQSVNFSSTCGVVKNGSVLNPVSQAEFVTVEAVDTDLIIITRQLGVERGNQQLVKLHGLSSSGVSGSRRQQGIDIINQRGGAGAYLVIEDQNCTVQFQDGGLGVVGNLFGVDGVNVNELLLTGGNALSENDSCNGDLIDGCYASLEAQAPPETVVTPIVAPPSNGGGSGNIGGGAPGDINAECSMVSDFVDGAGNALWKPHSERTGTPVILMPPEYSNAAFAVFNSAGQIVATPVIRDCCSHNGGREHIYLDRDAGSLAGAGVPLLAKFAFADGFVDCRTVPDPNQRYD